MLANSSNEALPKIGVVIVNYTSFADTIRYINSCLLQQLDVDLRIVVVDNDSPNESFSLLEEEFGHNEKIILLRNKLNSGYSAGNNLGIHTLEKTGCEFILISNNDIEFEDKLLLKNLAEEYKRLEKVSFIAPVMLIDNRISEVYSAWRLPDKWKEILSSTYLLKFLGYFYIKKFYYAIDLNEKTALKVECLGGSLFLGSLEAFKEIDYLDEKTFLYYEETIIGQKVKKLNRHNYLIQGLTYNHIREKSINKKYNYFQKHRILLESKKHYWKSYRNTGWLFQSILEFLYFINMLETIIIKPGLLLNEIAGK